MLYSPRGVCWSQLRLVVSKIGAPRVGRLGPPWDRGCGGTVAATLWLGGEERWFETSGCGWVRLCCIGMRQQQLFG